MLTGTEKAEEIGALLQSMHRVKKVAFPDLFFSDGESHNSLRVRIDQPVSAVRIGCESGTPLRLDLVEFLGHLTTSVDANPSLITVLRPAAAAGSAWKIEESDRSGTDQNQKMPAPVVRDGVDPSTVILNFSEPVHLKTVRVSNHMSADASDMWTLTVSVSDDGDSWRTVYDHRERIEEYINVCSGTWQFVNSPLDSDVLDTVFAVFRDVAYGRFDDARHTLNAGLGDVPGKGPMWAAIRDGMSDLVLRHTCKMWILHGISQPFKYFTEAEKDEYLAEAKKVMKALAKISPHVCLGFGTVLGFVRNGDFIEHDDDIDVLIAFDRDVVETIDKGVELVVERLTATGYEVTGDQLFSHRWVRVAAGRTLDVFVGLIEADRVSWHPGPREALLVADVFPAVATPFRKTPALMPCRPIEYVRKTYGEDWRTPMIFFRHQWTHAEYADQKEQGPS